ncbi:uncharacterized protein J7T54_006237 [Emericellopsis cladophorae]|uniref:Uncharacterized protein n=1 Tax=Emericellopsis cladophorae TaxID=2686198 RepID=A0A9P9Y9J2_9HYPO|nr:uncharacterized protein J7T54_006237 [Emericellopsis cladophorae]KAI6785898.1 hypothetical protein J7T54_006237 [Emericellopsis cladophorae]
MPSLTGKVKTWLQRTKSAEEEPVQVETPLDSHEMDIAAEAVKRLKKGDRWESVKSQIDARRRMHAQRQGHDRVLAGDWHIGPDKRLYQYPNPYIQREPHKVHIIYATREELDMLEEAGMTNRTDEEFVASYFPKRLLRREPQLAVQVCQTLAMRWSEFLAALSVDSRRCLLPPATVHLADHLLIEGRL